MELIELGAIQSCSCYFSYNNNKVVSTTIVIRSNNKVLSIIFNYNLESYNIDKILSNINKLKGEYIKEVIPDTEYLSFDIGSDIITIFEFDREAIINLSLDSLN